MHCLSCAASISLLHSIQPIFPSCDKGYVNFRTVDIFGPSVALKAKTEIVFRAMISITKLTGSLGATLAGINLSAPSAEDIASLKQGLNEHLVVFVEDQDLDRFQLSALGRHFGPPFLHPLVNNGFDDCPDVLELRREPDQTIMFGGESWHADVTWLKPNGYVSILHGKTLPETGGDTAFSSTIAAFEALSTGMKEQLRKLNAIHSYYGPRGEETEPFVATQPVVRKHPATYREGIYLNRMFVIRFEGMTAEESQPLLGYLYSLMERHEFTCRFKWRQGGVILWDNRFTLHYPINDFVGERRIMIRTTALEP